MSLFLDPTGQPTFGIALCARCSRKFFLAELYPDPNSPGLMVCEDDRDVYDPYRLPSRPEDPIALPFVRPDENIDVSLSQSAPAPPVASTYTFWSSNFWAPNFWAANYWAINSSWINTAIYDESGHYLTDEYGNPILLG